MAYAAALPHCNGKFSNGTKINGASFLSNEFLLAWEDTPFTSSDLDYNDFVVLVESVHSVPEPAALGMFGFGMLLIGAAVGLSRRRFNIG